MKNKDCKAKKKEMAKKMAKAKGKLSEKWHEHKGATAADKRDVAFAKKTTDYSQPRS